MNAWLTGNTVTAADKISRRLRIPNDLTLVAAVTGAILELTRVEKWEQMGTATPEETAALMATMFEEYLKGSNDMIGAILPYVTADVPLGTIACDGGTYDRAVYPLLYAKIDPIFIVNADQFITPDLSGRTIIGSGSGLSAHFTGESAGEESHQLTIAEMPSHSHQSYAHHVTGRTGAIDLYTFLVEQNLIDPLFTYLDGTATGGDGQHNNMQPYIAAKYCIVAW